MTDTDTLIAELRDWTKDHDAHVRAAVELLIWHGDGGYWLRRSDFRTAAVVTGGRHRQTWIDWELAREFFDAGKFTASSSEMAVLDLAIALGENRYRLSIMGAAHSRAIAAAVAAAVGGGPVEAISRA